MFDAIEKALDATVQELTDCLEFISASSKLRPWLGDYVDWHNIGKPAQRLVIDFLNQKNVREQVIYRALYASGHAVYEEFTRSIVIGAADHISNQVDGYDNLWEELRKEHVFRTGQAMETIHQPLEHYAFDYEQLCMNIGNCVPGSPNIKLNSHALALIRGTLSPENFEKVIKRLSIPFNWDTLASYSRVKSFFEAEGAHDCTKQLKEYLANMVKIRNRIAHSSALGGEIGEDQVREQLQFLKVFCHALSAYIKSEVNKKLPRAGRN